MFAAKYNRLRQEPRVCSNTLNNKTLTPLGVYYVEDR
jgi:hypothetical protein